MLWGGGFDGSGSMDLVRWIWFDGSGSMDLGQDRFSASRGAEIHPRNRAILEAAPLLRGAWKARFRLDSEAKRICGGYGRIELPRQ